MNEYTIVIEDAGSNFTAYVLDFDGCISTGTTIEEVTANMREAIATRKHRSFSRPPVDQSVQVRAQKLSHILGGMPLPLVCICDCPIWQWYAGMSVVWCLRR